MLADRLRVWKTAYNTANLPVGMTTPPDSVSKWIVITRAAVFSMTVTSGLIGGLLAIGASRLLGGFTVDYGLLLPLSGFANVPGRVEASPAHALHLVMAWRY